MESTEGSSNAGSPLFQGDQKSESPRLAQHEEMMKLAIKEAVTNVNELGGGPFGAAIVKDGKLIATGSNKVTINHDPTAHGEMVAIRNAC